VVSRSSDYLHGRLPGAAICSRRASGRRKLHDRRPEELRAINAVDDAMAGSAVRRNQDLIINLAIEMETPCRLIALKNGRNLA